MYAFMCLLENRKKLLPRSGCVKLKQIMNLVLVVTERKIRNRVVILPLVVTVQT